MSLNAGIVFAQLVLRSNFGSTVAAAALDIDLLKSKLDTFATGAKQVGRVWTQSVTLPIVAGMGSVTKAAVDFESSFAGIKKTVDGVGDRLGRLTAEGQKLQTEIRGLSREIPISVHELNKIGESAGALGIPKEAIKSFTEVIAKLGVTTDLTTAAAADGIAKIQNIYESAGVDTDRFASTLVRLGNESAATESAILEMASRIAGTGRVIGISQAQVLGLSAALSSVGIEAEMGGSAMSRVMVKMAQAAKEGGAATAEFGRIWAAAFPPDAGKRATDFAAAFQVDAAGTIGEFVKGLKQVQKAGENVFQTLKGLDLDEIRVQDTLLRAAGAGDLFAKTLKTANAEWSENNALAREAAIRFQTVASKLQLLWNWVYDIAITLGGTFLPAIRAVLTLVGLLLVPFEKLVQLYASLPTPIHLVVGGFLLLVAAIGPLAFALGVAVSAAVSLAGTFYLLHQAWRLWHGLSLQAPAALRALGMGLDHVVTWLRAGEAATWSFDRGIVRLTEGLGREGVKIAQLLPTVWDKLNAGILAVNNNLSAMTQRLRDVGTALAQSGMGQATGTVAGKLVGGAAGPLGGWFANKTVQPQIITDPRRLLPGDVTVVAPPPGLIKGAWEALKHPITSVTSLVTTLKNAFSSMWGAASRALGWLGGQGAAGAGVFANALRAVRVAMVLVVEYLTWPVILAAGFVYLLSLIPRVRGVVADLCSIFVNLAKIALAGVWQALQEVWGAIKDVASDLTWATGKVMMAIPGMETMTGWVEKLWKKWNDWADAIHKVREALDKFMASPMVSRQEIHDLVPKNPFPDGRQQPGMNARQGIGFSFDPLIDVTDDIAVEMAIWTGITREQTAALDDLIARKPGLEKMVMAMLQAPGDQGEKEAIVAALGRVGVNADMASGLIERFTDKLQKNEQAAQKAAQKAAELAQKLAALDASISGQKAIDEAEGMMGALDRLEKRGITIATMGAEQKELVNKALRGGVDALTALGKAHEIPIEMSERLRQTQFEVGGVLFDTAEKAEEYRKKLQDLIHPLTELPGLTTDIVERNHAWVDTMYANSDATRELTRATEDYLAAANALPFNSLGGQLDGLSVKYARLREDLERWADDVEFFNGKGFVRNTVQWQDRLVALTKAEAAERAKVTAEFQRSLPMTKQMQRELLVLERNSLYWALAIAYATGNAKLVEQILLRIKEINHQISLQKWDKFFELLPVIGQISDTLVQMGEDIEGRFGKVLDTIGKTGQAIMQAGQAWKAFKEAGDNKIGQIAAIGQGVAAMWQATGTNNSTANVTGGAISGMTTGAMIGSIIPGVGTVIGGAVGFVIGGALGAIRNNAEWRKVGRDIGRDWGVSISDELAKAIAKVSKQIGRQDAPLFFLKEIFEEAGGVAKVGLDTAIQKTRQLFSAIERGTMTSAQAGQELGDVFAELAAEATKGGGIASKQFLELIALQKQFGITTQATTDFLKAQTQAFAAGARLRVDAFAKSFNLDKIAKLKEDIAGRRGEPGERDPERERLEAELAKAQQAIFNKLGGTRVEVQQEFSRMGMYAGITFFETLKNEGFSKAMEAAGPMFAQLKDLTKEFGFELEGVGKMFGRFYDLATANPETMQALDGLSQMIVGAGNAMMLNQELMDAFSADAAAMFTRLTEGGASGNEALVMMQPTLQALWEAQDRFGLAVDATTQGLIDQAVQQGIVGEQGRSVQERMLNVLLAIAEALDADIPAAFDTMRRAGEDAANGVRNALNDIPDTIDVDVNVNHPGGGDYTGGGSNDGTGGEYAATGGRAGYGRILRFAYGGFVPSGTDTVPAMLTPGEVVLNAGQQKNVASQLAMADLVAQKQSQEGTQVKDMAAAFAQALRSSGAGEAGIVVVNAGKAGDAFDQVVANLPRSVRQNKHGIRTALREALGVAS